MVSVGEPDPSELSTKVTTPDPEALGALLDEYVENDIEIIKLYSGIRKIPTSRTNQYMNGNRYIFLYTF